MRGNGRSPSGPATQCVHQAIDLIMIDMGVQTHADPVEGRTARHVGDHDPVLAGERLRDRGMVATGDPDRDDSGRERRVWGAVGASVRGGGA